MKNLFSEKKIRITFACYVSVYFKRMLKMSIKPCRDQWWSKIYQVRDKERQSLPGLYNQYMIHPPDLLIGCFKNNSILHYTAQKKSQDSSIQPSVHCVWVRNKEDLKCLKSRNLMGEGKNIWRQLTCIYSSWSFTECWTWFWWQRDYVLPPGATTTKKIHEFLTFCQMASIILKLGK